MSYLHSLLYTPQNYLSILGNMSFAHVSISTKPNFSYIFLFLIYIVLFPPTYKKAIHFHMTEHIFLNRITIQPTKHDMLLKHPIDLNISLHIHCPHTKLLTALGTIKPEKEYLQSVHIHLINYQNIMVAIISFFHKLTNFFFMAFFL